MHKKFRLSTALDIDDLLMECTSYAVKLANEKYNFDPPLSLYLNFSTIRISSAHSRCMKAQRNLCGSFLR